LRIGQRWPLRSPPRQRSKDINAPFAQLCVGDRFSHQVRNYRAFVLSSEGFVEFGFDVIGDAEIHRGHIRDTVVEDFNNIHGLEISVSVNLGISVKHL
jgi:hypothetical protein